MEALSRLLGISSIAAYIVLAFGRALVFIALASVVIQVLTRNRRITMAYWGAHLAAILGGCLVDVVLFVTLPKEYISVGFLEIIFVTPIFLFTAIALWICHWKKPITPRDVFMPLLPITAWGCLVIWGWQDMDATHVMGAWFVSAGSGAADLISLYGPGWATRRRFLTRFCSYALILILVYLIIPFTV